MPFDLIASFRNVYDTEQKFVNGTNDELIADCRKLIDM